MERQQDKIPLDEKRASRELVSTFVRQNRIGEIERLMPYDFEQDGRQEFLIGERLPRSARSLHWYVVFLRNGGIKKIEPPPYGVKVGRLRGHQSIEVTNDGLIKIIAPIYLPEDANCCPSGGERVFLFEFQNDDLQLINADIGRR